ncbi:MAG TPA: rod shape-determining protein [Pyrinomonadaceae bacterium]|jgi:rod shape-determining protein MreB|nr:rod shape-determining protein [Pyrinomonadaceae bacterium]
MNILSSFFTDDLAIDLGTVNTLIYAPGRGVVLNEPSTVAIHKYTGEVLAVGAEAFKLLGREPRDTEVHRPVRGGTIEDFEVTEKMLRAFINRVHGGHSKRSHLVIGVPGSSTALEQRSVRDAAHDAKATRVDLVDEGLAAALGAGLDFEEERAHLVVDIGGGTTNIAIIASAAVVSSVSLRSAGNTMDEAIRDYVRNKHTMQIGERMAEEVKKELGTARSSSSAAANGNEPFKERYKEVVGKDLTDGSAKAVELSSTEVCEALEPVISELVAGARRVIEESQPDVTADIYHTGIILTGGGALLDGMAERLQQELRLHVATADEPLASVALGAGRLLAHPEKLQRVSIRQDVPAWQASEELIVNW